jgi:hypothetical protein
MKKLRFSLYLSLLLMLLLGGNVYAYSDIFYSVGTGAPGTGPIMELRTANFKALRTLTFNVGQVSASSYSIPTSDPIIGQFNSITTAYYNLTGAFSYQLRNEVGTTGVWHLTDQFGNPMVATITAASAADPSDPARVVYFQADVKATTIDLVNGTIAWEAVSKPTFPDALAGSETMAQLQYYVDNAILTSFQFAGSTALATWMRETSASVASKQLEFSTNVTVVPEPAEWALMLAGLGLIGFSIYRRRSSVDIPVCRSVSV